MKDETTKHLKALLNYIRRELPGWEQEVLKLKTEEILIIAELENRGVLIENG